MVSTAPGFFKGSALVMPVRPDGTVQRVPLAKAYLKRSLSKVERDAVHDYLVGALDQLGNDKISLTYAIEGAFSVAKARGLILDYIIGGRPSRGLRPLARAKGKP